MATAMLFASVPICIIATVFNISNSCRHDVRKYIAGQVLTIAGLALFTVGLLLLVF